MPVFDVEGDSLTPTKFYVLSYSDGGEVKSLTTHKQMAEWLVKQDVLIGHNIILWDIPQLERVLGIKIKARLIDTLGLSWYLFPDRIRHGLEYWGQDLGIKKPEIESWTGLPLEKYIERCEEDVKITLALWDKERYYLQTLYSTPFKEVHNLPIVKYLTFKLHCAALQEASKWKLDKELCVKTLEHLYAEKELRVKVLVERMPKIAQTVVRSKPSKPFKKDGTLSVAGAKWFNLLKREGLTNDHTDPICEVTGYEDPNPNSPLQLKEWLFSLGWEPETFDYKREDNGQFRKIPQIKKKSDPELCSSVLELVEKEPGVEALAGLSIISHRITVLEAFLKNVDEEGFIKAEIQGFTNTLRFKHTVVVNLPGIDKPYGKEIRGCLIAREGMVLCGSDMSSLEDNTKKHYMWDYDPEYVTEMSKPGFDSHLDLAVFAGAATPEEVEKHKLGEINLTPIRKKYKMGNYACVYGAQAPKLSRELKIPEPEAAELVNSYWERNWSVKKIAEDCKVKSVAGQKWLFNPVSKFWYSLRAEKDRFSTLNQGTGVFCFDFWIREILNVRPQLTAQFHDEIVIEIKEGAEDKCRKLLKDCIQKVNDKLKLNVQLDVGVDFGNRYSEIH